MRINVRDARTGGRGTLRSLQQWHAANRVEFFDVPTDEPWCRDHGPIFLKRKERPRLAAVNFGFNAWGYKLSPFEERRRCGDAHGGEDWRAGIRFRRVCPRGRVNRRAMGRGTVLTTESCLLNPNRNPDLSRESRSKRISVNLWA